MMILSGGVIENFHFLRPLLLLGLMPALVLILILRYFHSARTNWSRSIDPSLLPYLLDRNLQKGNKLPLYGLALLWLLGIVAAAGPVWEELPVPVQQREDALVILADLSMSMYAEDLKPNRVTRLQRKILDSLNQRKSEGETGLIVYAGTAHTVTPLTDDIETISNLVPSLQPNIMPSQGSQPHTAVRLALELLANAQLPKAHLLLYTDGIEIADIQSITSELAGTQHRLSVLGFGTDNGAPVPTGQMGYLRDENNAIVIPRLDRAPLQQLVSLTSGRYADAQLNDDDINYLLEEIILNEEENLRVIDDREFDTWYEAGPWLLLFVIPLAALAFRRGWLLVLFVTLPIFQPKTVYALNWKDLWQTKDQQGSDYYKAEQYHAAGEQFEDPQWRAMAHYRAGEYEKALSDLAGLNTPESNYNRGNTLAQMGLYQEAIDAYESTLSEIADHKDALRNKELVEKLLEQQQQDEQQQQQDGDKQDNNQEEEEQQQDQQQQDQQQKQDQQDQQNQQQEKEQNQDQNENKDQNEEQQDQDQQEEEEQNSEEQQQDQQSPTTEEEQAMQQWLMRIPDDPGELLRNKFRYQTQQRMFEQLQNPEANDTGNNKKW
jgi:Ca-activated chloride channel family protein